MTQNCFKLICRSSATEIFNRDGLLPLYFSIELPEPFAREEIPQASIIVSRTWKLRFTSNSISVADPEGVRGVQTNPLLSLNYIIFMGNFRKNWSNCTNRTPLSQNEPPIQKSWIRPCISRSGTGLKDSGEMGDIEPGSPRSRIKTF